VARTQLFNRSRPNVTKLAVLITDGTANLEAATTVSEADITKAQNVEVFCVGITNDVRIACSHSNASATNTPYTIGT